MGVARTGQVLSTGTVLDTDNGLDDHLTCTRTHDVSAQQLVSLLFSEDLDKSVSVGDGLGPRVGEEGENSLGVVDV